MGTRTKQMSKKQKDQMRFVFAVAGMTALILGAVLMALALIFPSSTGLTDFVNLYLGGVIPFLLPIILIIAGALLIVLGFLDIL